MLLSRGTHAVNRGQTGGDPPPQEWGVNKHHHGVPCILGLADLPSPKFWLEYFHLVGNTSASLQTPDCPRLARSGLLGGTRSSPLESRSSTGASVPRGTWWTSERCPLGLGRETGRRLGSQAISRSCPKVPAASGPARGPLPPGPAHWLSAALLSVGFAPFPILTLPPVRTVQ